MFKPINHGQTKLEDTKKFKPWYLKLNVLWQDQRYSYGYIFPICVQSNSFFLPIEFDASLFCHFFPYVFKYSSQISCLMGEHC